MDISRNMVALTKIFTDVTIWLLIPTVVLTVFYAFWSNIRSKYFPPGPPIVPILGSLPFVNLRGTPIRIVYKKLAEKYGPVFSLAIGSKLVVIISGYHNIHQALVNQAQDFGGRSVHRYRSKHFNPGPHGIGGSNTTPEWHNQHRLGLSILRSLGYGRGTTERRIQYECQAIRKIITDTNQQPFDPTCMMKTGCMNVICSLIMGRHYEHGDQALKNLMDLMDEFIQLIFKDTDGDVIPLLRLRPGHKKSMEKFIAISTRLVQFIRELLTEKEAEYAGDEDEESSPEDRKSTNFVQAYMREWRKVLAGARGDKVIEENWLYTFVLDMLLTGSQSVPTVMSWFILYMMKFPDVQRKVQQELDHVYGPVSQCSDVCLDLKSSCPYTEAVMCEMMRLSCVSPLGYPHSTAKDTEYMGFDIPANTEVWVNLWETTRDPTLWKDPETFDPSRFLDSSEQLSVPAFWIPFGVGKRACFGEQLARQEMFLIFTTLLRSFTFQPPRDVTLNDIAIEPVDEILVLKPQPYTTCAVPRQPYTYTHTASTTCV